MSSFEGERPEPVGYEPRSVKELLVEMKDTAELLIDLSYSALLHRSDAVAGEVLRLEREMDVLQLRARMSLLLAARNPDDAERLAPVLSVVEGTDRISDAAGDIAKIVHEEIGLPDELRGALSGAVELLVRAELEPASRYAGRTLAEIDLESETGVRVIAIRRGDDWVLNPGAETGLRGGDALLLRGPERAVGGVYERAAGEPFEPEPPAEPGVAALERAVESIALMKDLSELAVDLAYGSVLFDDADLAEEVRNLEVEMDALQLRFEAWTLGAAADASDPASLRGLIRLGTATEQISDAAVDISEGVLRDQEVHPVVELAVRESDEIIARTAVEPGSALDGTDVVDGRPQVGVSTSVIAIRRGEEFLVGADLDATLAGGDVVIAKGTRTAAAAFAELAAA